MRKTTRYHEPRSGRSKPYQYEEVQFDTLREAWGYVGVGERDTRAQVAWLSKEATRRNRERANANVNAPNAPKPPEQKLLNNAVRIVGAPKPLVEKAKGGDVDAQAQIIAMYQDVLRSLEEAPVGQDADSVGAH